MAKKYSTDDVFKNFMTVEDVYAEEKETTEANKSEDKHDKPSQTIKLVQRSYYLTDDLLKAITLKTAEGNLDKSGVVREALTLYLTDILKKF